MADGHDGSLSSRASQYSRRACSWQKSQERPLSPPQRRHCSDGAPLSPEQAVVSTARAGVPSEKSLPCGALATVVAFGMIAEARTDGSDGSTAAFQISGTVFTTSCSAAAVGKSLHS